jgi:putative acetyltransferase
MAGVRVETPTDIAAMRAVNEAAFGRMGEADLVDALRQADALTASLVAVDRAGRVVGHAALSPVTITRPDGQVLGGALGLGPVAVLPEAQEKGHGSALVRAALDAARARGATGVVVVGDPGYYGRFGFRSAASFGLRWEQDVPEGVFQAVEFRPGAFSPAEGTPPAVVRYRPEFDEV